MKILFNKSLVTSKDAKYLRQAIKNLYIIDEVVGAQNE